MSTKRNAKHGDPEIVLSIRVTREQHTQLKALAERESRSISQQVRHLIAREILDVDETVAA